MKAACYMGVHDIEVSEVPEPKLLSATDAIVRITSTAICGSDLHLYDGYVPSVLKGDILGHEFMGEVVEVGAEVRRLHVGDRVVVPFPIACGQCNSCRQGLTSICENSNPNALMAEKLWGHSPAGIFGYSHLLGGYPGGQAEYARVPFADVGPLKVDDGLSDEQVLFLSDILPTGYMGAENCELRGGEVVAVWGAGPVGLFAAASALLLGAERVIVIDRLEYRLEVARRLGTETLNYLDVDIREALNESTGGRGPDACIDAVGMEAHHGALPLHLYDKAKQALRMETDRGHALRQAITTCRNGGVVSIVGVYGGFLDKFPVGSLMNRSLTVRGGQCHVHRYLGPLLERIRAGEIDPTVVISHRLPLEEAATGYELFQNKDDECLKVILRTSAAP
jgi:threonine dehydrogenase-like Zn-dependent dehydrogenase